MSTKLFTITTLLALSSALPSSRRSTDRSNCWETNPGTVFYNCANGYIGCFDSDPCSLPPLASTTTPAPTSTCTETPTSTPTPEAPKTLEITTPRSYNIYVLSEAQHDVEDKVGHVDLNKPANSRTTTTNAMVFDNVPSGAKNCYLNWRSTANDGTNIFTVSGKGQAWMRQLKGFPSGDEKVSFDGLKPYNEGLEWRPSLDFTGWEELPGSHLAGALECGEQVAVEVKGSDEGEEENRVFITLTETNGFFLTYEL